MNEQLKRFIEKITAPAGASASELAELVANEVCPDMATAAQLLVAALDEAPELKNESNLVKLTFQARYAVQFGALAMFEMMQSAIKLAAEEMEQEANA